MGHIAITDACAGAQITVTGTTTYTKTLNSVQSSSGSAGAWSYVLNLADVANIATTDYVTITNTSGGTYPEAIQGCWPVTNVDTVNKRITIAVSHSGSSAASGAVTSSYLTVLKTVCTFAGSNGFEAYYHGLGKLTKLAVVGNGTGYGVNAENGAYLTVAQPCGVYNWAYGLFANLVGTINAGSIVISRAASTTYGMGAINGGQIYANNGVVSGCVTGGLVAEYGSLIDFQYGISTGNGTYAAIAEYRAAVFMPHGQASWSTDGIYCEHLSFLDITSGTIAHTATGINCWYESVVMSTGVTFTSNTTNSTPAVNTIGNSNSYVVN